MRLSTFGHVLVAIPSLESRSAPHAVELADDQAIGALPVVRSCIPSPELQGAPFVLALHPHVRAVLEMHGHGTPLHDGT